MRNIKDHISVFLASNDIKKSLFDRMSKEFKETYVNQFVSSIITNSDNKELKNLDDKAITDKIINGMSKEETHKFVDEIRTYTYFLSYRQATDRLFSALGLIFEKDGNMSLKKAFEEYISNKEFTNDIISTSIAQTVKQLLVYKFSIIQELFDKLYDNESFSKDKRIVEIVENIKESAWWADEVGKQLIDFQKNKKDVTESDIRSIIDEVSKMDAEFKKLSNESVVRILRNGIAHFNYNDTSTTVDCLDANKLVENMLIKITSRDGKAYSIIKFSTILDLVDIMQENIEKGAYMISNVPQEFYDVPESGKASIIIDMYKQLKNYGKYEPFEIDYINNFLKNNTSTALTWNGYASIKVILKYPQLVMLKNIDKALQILEDLNKSRNKSNKNKLSFVQLIPTLSVVMLTNILSNLKSLDLVKDFVDDNINNPEFAKVSFLQVDKKSKKSVKKKFRLLRNCLEHAWLLDYGDSFYAYDVDTIIDEKKNTTKKEKIGIGEITYEDMLILCELMENYICKHYEGKFEEFKTLKKSQDDIM